MADQWAPGEAAPQGAGLIDAVEELAPRVAQMGAMMVAWPFYLLPPDARDDAIQATTRLFESVGRIHLGLVRAAWGSLSAATGALARGGDHQAHPASRSVTKVPIETSSPTA